MKIALMLFSVLSIFFASMAEAHLDFPIEEVPIEDVAPLCEQNPNSTQIIVAGEHLRAIQAAVQCGDLKRALQISHGLSAYLKDEVANQGLGICYDDRKCTQPNSNSHVTKATCSAAGGKGWIQVTPTAGSCERI